MDTNVLVAAVRSRNGAANALLSAATTRRYRMLVSVPLFLEYEAVLTRPEHLVAAQVTEQDMLGFLDYLADIVEPVHINYLWRPSLNDPADEMVLETAING
ncbi:putative toxin-antitoxin system toxin component, PIN family [Asticcacaulis sp.]|uniref:PIN domain-containing protein n=1 Tax=Asticcacaulis sp. TaxID=1872648 RepID=UPI00260AE5D6|nr:PIN domain-containing protein [Asticcacaulis sp.]